VPAFASAVRACRGPFGISDDEHLAEHGGGNLTWQFWKSGPLAPSTVQEAWAPEDVIGLALWRIGTRDADECEAEVSGGARSDHHMAI
jgi:hypothetical protein